MRSVGYSIDFREKKSCLSNKMHVLKTWRIKLTCQIRDHDMLISCQTWAPLETVSWSAANLSRLGKLEIQNENNGGG